MGLIAYLSIKLSSIELVLSSHWFIPKPLSLLLNHFNSLSPSTRTSLCESPTRYSSLRVPALLGLYSRYRSLQSLGLAQLWMRQTVNIDVHHLKRFLDNVSAGGAAKVGKHVLFASELDVLSGRHF